MLGSLIHLFKALYAYCTDFVINLANLTGLSYYEINFTIFLVLFPLALLLSVLLFLKQKSRLRSMKKMKREENNEINSSGQIDRKQLKENKFFLQVKRWGAMVLHPIYVIAFASPFGLFLFSNEPSCMYFAYIILFLFAVSIIYTLLKRKWLLALTGFCLQVGYMICMCILVFIICTIIGYPSIGNHAFYSAEINSTTNLTIPKELQLISKIDTIYYGGIENEYEAECVYQGPKHMIAALEDSLKVQPGISKNEGISDFSNSVINLSQFKKKDIGSYYSMSSEGSYNIDIAFNKQKTKMYYSAYYY